MKPKLLLLAIALLGLAAAAVWYARRPGSAPADAAGRKPLAPEVASRATRFEIHGPGPAAAPAVVIEKRDGRWVVPEYHGLPADFPKLTRFTQELLDATIEREVSRSATALERLELGKNRVVLKDDAGAVLLDLTLGKSGPNGGAFAKLGDDDAGYLLRQSLWIDATRDNWAQKKPLDIEEKQVAELTVEFRGPGQPALTLKREKEGEEFRAEGLAEGETLKAGEATRLLNSLLAARFTEVVTDRAHPDVTGATEHAVTLSLKTFRGQQVQMRLGRRPPQPVAPPPGEEPPPAIAAEPTEPATPAAESATPWSAEAVPAPDAAAASAPPPAPALTPAGPVFIDFDLGDPDNPWQQAGSRLAFKFSDWIYNQIPENRAQWIEVKPAEPPAAPAAAPAEPPPANPGPAEAVAAPPARAPIVVTTPPIAVPPLPAEPSAAPATEPPATEAPAAPATEP